MSVPVVVGHCDEELQIVGSAFIGAGDVDRVHTRTRLVFGASLGANLDRSRHWVDVVTGRSRDRRVVEDKVSALSGSRLAASRAAGVVFSLLVRGDVRDLESIVSASVVSVSAKLIPIGFIL